MLLIIVIARVFTRLSCREWFTILGILWRCTLGGQEECMMQEYSWTPHCTREARMEHFSLTGRRPFVEKRFHCWCWEIPPILSYPGLWKPFLTTVAYPASRRPSIIGWVKLELLLQHAYGRLKGRWRCLLKRNDVLVCDLPKLVAACCVLHNMCEIHGETFDEDWMNVTDHTSVNTASTASASLDSSGRDVRQALMTYFNQ